MTSFQSVCINNLQLQYFTDSETFDDATHICNLLGPGGSLVTIESFDKYENVTKFYNFTGEISDANYWIGLRALNPETGLRDPLRFNWINGLDSQSFFSNADTFPWRDGRPNNSDAQNCISIRLDAQVFEDTLCTFKKEFMCQVECFELVDTPTINLTISVATVEPTSTPTTNPSSTTEEKDDESDENSDGEQDNEDSNDEDSDEEDDNDDDQEEAPEGVSSFLNIGLIFPLDILFIALPCFALFLCCLTRFFCMKDKKGKEEKARQDDCRTSKIQSSVILDLKF